MPCTFYVIPGREMLGRQFAGFLTGLFPGLDWTATSVGNLADMLAAMAESHESDFVIYRDDLGDGDLEHNLIEHYGGEQGDLVVEVAEGHDGPPAPARLWRITRRHEADKYAGRDEIAVNVAIPPAA
jgi:hypothetical protein